MPAMPLPSTIDRRRALITAALFAAILAPALAAVALGIPALSRSLMTGAVLAVPATFRLGPRAGLLAGVVAAACAGFGSILPPFVPVIAIWMAVLGFLAGIATARGRQPLLATAPVAVAFVLAQEVAAADPLAAIPPLLGILAGGAWIAAVAAVIARGRAATPVAIVPEPLAIRYAFALAAALGIAGWLVAATGDGHGYWLVTAIVAVFQPDPAQSRVRAVERVAFTLVGAAAGIVLVQVGLPAGALVAIAAAAAAAAVYQLLGRVRSGRIWLTIAIVCMGGTLEGSIDLAAVRVVATVGAGLLVVLATLLIPVVTSPDGAAPDARLAGPDPT